LPGRCNLDHDQPKGRSAHQIHANHGSCKGHADSTSSDPDGTLALTEHHTTPNRPALQENKGKRLLNKLLFTAHYSSRRHAAVFAALTCRSTEQPHVRCVPSTRHMNDSQASLRMRSR